MENIKILIDFIFNDHAFGENDYRSFKFPFNACEILMSENLFVIDKMFIASTDESQKLDSLNLVSKESSEIEVEYHK